ncbi:MAG: nucleoside deaminase [Alphaproteobacteria bacterium]|nr:nucleoside deaminase [Alphaproteobacteria bacterium]
MPDLDHQHFMQLAIEEGEAGIAEGNRPIGSVIVRDGEVIATGRNTVNKDGDPTNHAETVAIRDACQRFSTVELPGTTLYTTMEPCPMCLWVIAMTKIDRLVMGARHADFQPHNYGTYTVEELLSLTGQHVEVLNDVLRPECIALRDVDT